MRDSNAPGELTPRELEVVELIANGESAKSIALKLNLSPSTVDRHVENVRNKLNARNRVQMITHALERGFLHVQNGAGE